MVRFIFICLSVMLTVFPVGEGFADQQDWRQEFARICSKTAEADMLSVQELESLINDSEKLLSLIKTKDDMDVKLYLIKTKKCRNFLIFMRDTAKNSP